MTTTIDTSLWFNSFSLLLTDLETPNLLEEKLNENRTWLLNTVTLFKSPTKSSKDALTSQQQQKELVIGSSKLSVKPQLRDLALKLSSTVGLDEIQSYILVDRFFDKNIPLDDGIADDYLHEMVLHYYTERQCLLKCVRQMIIHALNAGSGEQEGNSIQRDVAKLFSDGLEDKSISVIEKILSASYPMDMDVDLYVLWAEETLIESNLILDILFLSYYESLRTCGAANWKRLCLLYKGMATGSSAFVKLGVSAEAFRYSYRAKIQMLLILLETLDFENLLQMIHDETPFRNGSCVFSSDDIMEMDSIIASFDSFETREVGPLILGWAVFVCLVASLSSKQEPSDLMEIDHVGYVRQAFEAGSLSFLLEILRTDTLKDSDGPVAGYESILRTFIAAFIASYDLSIQLEDDTLRLILAILCEIYRGEEALCVQFWDKQSVVDGPIRCLLRSLEGEFPNRTIELTRLLSALCEGSWPAECVFNFMEKSMAISSLLEISGGFAGGVSQIIETQLPLHVPAVEGLMIPSKTRGHVLRMIDAKTALVSWEYKQSGVLILLLRLAQSMELDGNEEIHVILDLFNRLASFNTAVCLSLMKIGKSFNIQTNYDSGAMETDISIDILEVLCNSIRSLSPYSGSVLTMSLGINILTRMMRCSPSHVTAVMMRMNIFDLSLKTSIFSSWSSCDSSASWLPSGRLAKMLLIDCEHNADCPLTVAVLDFTMQLMEAGVENDVVLALVIFCLQYVFVNHEYWKYKVKQDRWKVTLKVLEVLKTSITSMPYLTKIAGNVKDVILSDSSIHNMFLRIVCITSPALEKLYNSQLFDWREIDGLQRAIFLALDILVSFISSFSEDDLSRLPTFLQAVLSTSTKPIPAVVALASLVSYQRDPDIQAAATSALSMLCIAADLSGISNMGLDSKQVSQLRLSMEHIIQDQSERNEELVVAVLKLLTSAANHQPAFLVALLSAEDSQSTHSRTNGDLKESSSDASVQALKRESATRLVDVLVHYFEKPDAFVQSGPRVLLSMLQFVKASWLGAAQYADIMETIRKCKKFWKQLSECILVASRKEAPPRKDLPEAEALKYATIYQSKSAALDILALELFLQKRLLHAESLMKRSDEQSKGGDVVGADKHVSTSLQYLEECLSSWTEGSVWSNLLMSSGACNCDTNIYVHAKTALGMLVVHIIEKLADDDTGSLSVSFIEKVTALCTKLFSLAPFSELCAQYNRRGYSEGTQMKTLILSDLYYHMQGELEGRAIEHGSFKEISNFIMSSNLVQFYQNNCSNEPLESTKLDKLFDLSRLQRDIGLDIWDHSGWKASRQIAETVLLHLEDANSMLTVVGSRLKALQALTTIVTLDIGESDQSQKCLSKRVSKDGILSSIDHVCKEFQGTVGVVASSTDVPDEVLHFLVAQSEFLLCLARSVDGGMPSSFCLVILRTCSFALKGLRESRLLVSEVEETIKSVLTLLLLVMNSISDDVIESSTSKDESDAVRQVSNMCLGLLPLLCRCIELPDQSVISLATIDIIVKSFATPSTWLPIMQQHLPLQQLMLKLNEKRCHESLPVMFKFLLTLAGVRGGAEMLLAAGFLSSLRVLFTEIDDSRMVSLVDLDKSTLLGSKTEKPQSIWGLGIGVFTAIICSLRGTLPCIEVVDKMMSFFFSEEAHLIAHYLSAPDGPSDDRDKKRARAQKTQTSLSSLTETEHTLMLICVLAKHRNSWMKAMRATGSELRERIIHLLAFISRTNHCVGESFTRLAPLLCVPVLKEEIKHSKQPSYVKSSKGWFAFAAHGCAPVRNGSDEQMKIAIVLKDHFNGQAESSEPSFFSDTVAVQMYRISFFILKFLCQQADDAARRAEEQGFIDLSQFPELPDPEILHGLQDQSIAIVTEVCESSRSKPMQPETEKVCLLLLNILEMALYLEYCVSQICGIRPVLGHVEDFTKGVRSLVRATQGQTFLENPMTDVKQIISFLYPGLLHGEGIL